MIFSNDKAIYVQIAGQRLSDEILAGKYKEDERIPSVREYAVLLEVNANTTVKAYDLLATDEIIYNKRGLGDWCFRWSQEADQKDPQKGVYERKTSGSLPTDAASRHLHRRSEGRVGEESQKDKDMMTLFIFKSIFLTTIFALYIIRWI